MLRLFLLVVLACVVISLLDDSGAGVVSIMTGTVVESQVGQSISVANDQTDPGGVRINLRLLNRDGDRGSIPTGARVVVSYRSVGEREPVAITLKMLGPADSSRP